MRLLAVVAILAAVSAQGFEQRVKEVERLDVRAKRTDAWLRTASSGDALVHIEPMEHDFNELLAGEIHRRERVSFRITTRREQAEFVSSGRVTRGPKRAWYSNGKVHAVSGFLMRIFGVSGARNGLRRQPKPQKSGLRTLSRPTLPPDRPVSAAGMSSPPPADAPPPAAPPGPPLSGRNPPQGIDTAPVEIRINPCRILRIIPCG